MPKCKLSNCREEAVPYGKRYCPAHKAVYEAKKRAYAEVAATLPDCLDCGRKVSPNRASAGEIRCTDCGHRHEERRRRAVFEQERFEALDSAASVQEIKEWLARYVLPGL